MRRFATVCCCYDFSEKYYNKSGMERLCVAKTKVCGDLRMLVYETISRCFATNTPNSFIALHNMKPMCDDLQQSVVTMIFREKLQRKCDGTALCSKNESLW